MATALDIIIDALQKLGAYAPGETLSDADAQRGLSVMNDMLDTWSNETLMIYCNQQQSIAMVAGQVTAVTVLLSLMFLREMLKMGEAVVVV